MECAALCGQRDLGSRVQHVLSAQHTTLCPFPYTSDSKDEGKLVCACENEKGTCVNGTCRGDICFYTWLRGYDERGCFSQKNYMEQCFTILEGFYVKCCHNDLCNYDLTLPPDISQCPFTSFHDMLHAVLWRYHCVVSQLLLSLLPSLWMGAGAPLWSVRAAWSW